MDAREAMRRWIAMVTQQAAQGGNGAIKQGIELLSSAQSDLNDQLDGRNWMQAQRQEKGHVSQPAASSLPAKAPVKRPKQPRVNRTQKSKPATQGRSMGRRGARQVARPRPDTSLPLQAQKNQLRHHIYGRDTEERRFLQAAKALTS